MSGLWPDWTKKKQKQTKDKNKTKNKTLTQQYEAVKWKRLEEKKGYNTKNEYKASNWKDYYKNKIVRKKRL